MRLKAVFTDYKLFFDSNSHFLTYQPHLTLITSKISMPNITNFPYINNPCEYIFLNWCEKLIVLFETTLLETSLVSTPLYFQVQNEKKNLTKYNSHTKISLVGASLSPTEFSCSPYSQCSGKSHASAFIGFQQWWNLLSKERKAPQSQSVLLDCNGKGGLINGLLAEPSQKPYQIK